MGLFHKHKERAALEDLHICDIYVMQAWEAAQWPQVSCRKS